MPDRPPPLKILPKSPAGRGLQPFLLFPSASNHVETIKIHLDSNIGDIDVIRLEIELAKPIGLVYFLSYLTVRNKSSSKVEALAINKYLTVGAYLSLNM